MKNKYSIYTILNSVYMKYFGKIFINSLYDKVDVDNIENIFIGDTGLNKSDKKYLQKFDKVKILDTTISDTGGSYATWDSNWHNSVTQKTKIFRKLIETENLPLIMLDADMLFLEDISSLIDTKYDIQVCFRNHERREKKHPMDYLACYVCVNNKKPLEFMDTWINMIDTENTVNINGNLIKAKETPCLCKVVELFKNTNNPLKIGDVDEDIVSVYDAPDILPEISRIIHFKGWGPYTFSNSVEEAFDGKVVKRGWGDYVKRYLV